MDAATMKGLIDRYSTDRSRWPADELADLDASLASDPEIADYFAEVKKIDDALTSWEPGEDGVDVGETTEEREGDEDADEDDADEDEDEDDSGAGSDGESTDDEGDDADGTADDEDEGDEDEGDGEDGEATMPSVGTDPQIDFEQAKDMDSMLEEALKKMLDNAFDDKLQIDFTREYDAIIPYDDSSGSEPNVRLIEQRIQSAISPMQRDLQRIIVARSQSYMQPGFRRGRINSAALHRVPAGDDRVFRRRQEAVTNKVAMSLVIDNSGSMCGSKVTTAMTAAWAFAETLERIKVACDVVGFTDWRYPQDIDRHKLQAELDEMIRVTGADPYSIRTHPFYMPIYKGFDEKFGPKQKRRMAHLIENQGILASNNDALALDYAGRRLLARSETRKIMIVFSDGMPAGYVAPGVLNRTVIHNVAALERAGVEVIGVGIESDAVKNFYKRHYVLNDVAALPTFVMRELKTLLT